MIASRYHINGQSNNILLSCILTTSLPRGAREEDSTEKTACYFPLYYVGNWSYVSQNIISIICQSCWKNILGLKLSVCRQDLEVNFDLKIIAKIFVTLSEKHVKVVSKISHIILNIGFKYIKVSLIKQVSQNLLKI